MIVIAFVHLAVVRIAAWMIVVRSAMTGLMSVVSM